MEGKARMKVLWLIFLNRRGQSRRNSGFRGSSDELIKYVFPIENGMNSGNIFSFGKEIQIINTKMDPNNDQRLFVCDAGTKIKCMCSEWC